MKTISLQCHPDTPSAIVRQINVSVAMREDGWLAAAYTLAGAIDQIRIDNELTAGDALWQHTCFELFVGATNDAEYYEFNFSPSGGWALYGFRDYRDGALLHVEGMEPKITVRRESDELHLATEIPLRYLPGVHSGVQLSVGLSAVMEEIAGNLSYWAIKHPSGKPDFHHPDNFAVQVKMPSFAAGDRDCAVNP